jgi:hypothetical protein
MNLWAIGGCMFALATLAHTPLRYPNEVYDMSAVYPNLRGVTYTHRILESTNYSAALKSLIYECMQEMPNYRPTLTEVRRRVVLGWIAAASVEDDDNDEDDDDYHSSDDDYHDGNMGNSDHCFYDANPVAESPVDDIDEMARHIARAYRDNNPHDDDDRHDDINEDQESSGYDDEYGGEESEDGDNILDDQRDEGTYDYLEAVRIARAANMLNDDIYQGQLQPYRGRTPVGNVPSSQAIGKRATVLRQPRGERLQDLSDVGPYRPRSYIEPVPTSALDNDEPHETLGISPTQGTNLTRNRLHDFRRRRAGARQSFASWPRLTSRKSRHIHRKLYNTRLSWERIRSSAQARSTSSSLGKRPIPVDGRFRSTSMPSRVLERYRQRKPYSYAARQV